MKRHIAVASAMCAVLALVLVAHPAAAADESDLAARAATWEKEYNAGNLSAVAALYAEDGCRMPPNAPAVQGRAAILKALEAGAQQGIAKVKIAVTSAETHGDAGHGMGTFEIMAADGTTIDQGKWMNVSRKIGGTWLIQCDIFNSNRPLPGSE